MKIINLMRQTLPCASGVLLAVCMGAVSAEENATDSEQVLNYKLVLAEDGETYQVWMKSSATPKPDLSLTGQVTIRTPHDSVFMMVDVENYIEDAQWMESARTDAPEENPAYDYISLTYVGLTGGAKSYQWTADEEKLVFSFRNVTGCVSDVSLLNDNDPFNVPDNSAGTRPGNQFTNIGWGMVESNNYAGNEAETVNCS